MTLRAELVTMDEHGCPRCGGDPSHTECRPLSSAEGRRIMAELYGKPADVTREGERSPSKEAP